MIDIKTKAYQKASFALALGSFLVFCNLYLFQPLLPLLADEFQVSATRVNWIQAAGTLMLSLSLVPWAITSEIKGRRPIMLGSLFALPLIGLTYLLADNLWALTLTRALMGFALAGFAAIAVAYMAEEFTERALMMAMGSYIAANSLGGITGRVVGGLISEFWSWQGAAIVMTCLSLIGALVVSRLLPAQQHFSSQSHSLRFQGRAIIHILKQPKLLTAMMIGGINFALFMNLYSVMGFRLVEAPYSLPVGWVSLIFLCYLSGTLSSRLSGFWRQKYRASSGMLLGNSLSALGMWVAAWESLPAVLAGLLLISFGSFFTHSLAYGWISHRATTAKASASALYLVHYYVGGSLGGFFLLGCWQYKGWPAVLAGGMVLYSVIYLLCLKLKQYEKNDFSPVPSTT